MKSTFPFQRTCLSLLYSLRRNRLRQHLILLFMTSSSRSRSSYVNLTSIAVIAAVIVIMIVITEGAARHGIVATQLQYIIKMR
jgi:hypothetical protein